MPMIENWKLVVLERYTKFDGRAGRAEFWWFVLANLLVFLALAILIAVSNVFIILYFGYALALIVPSIAVAIRRLHDTNKSGWWLLIGIIPFGGLVLLVFYILEGTAGPNDHGVPRASRRLSGSPCPGHREPFQLIAVPRAQGTGNSRTTTGVSGGSGVGR